MKVSGYSHNTINNQTPVDSSVSQLAPHNQTRNGLIPNFSRLDRSRWDAKRFLDVVVSLLMSLAAAPLMFVISILIKLDSQGPVLYKQPRVGQNRRRSGIPHGHVYIDGGRLAMERRGKDIGGRPIQVIKFRSMHPDAEADGKAVWCKFNDPRVTRVGRVLRKLHLDELPQLVNVLKGEMSLVGPRPERPEFINELKTAVPGYEKRLFVKPGVTGLAQINHRSDHEINDVRRKIRYDVLYMRRAGVGTDLKIILATVPMALGLDAQQRKTISRRGLFVMEPVRFVTWFILALAAVAKTAWASFNRV